MVSPLIPPKAHEPGPRWTAPGRARPLRALAFTTFPGVGIRGRVRSGPGCDGMAGIIRSSSLGWMLDQTPLPMGDSRVGLRTPVSKIGPGGPVGDGGLVAAQATCLHLVSAPAIESRLRLLRSLRGDVEGERVSHEQRHASLAAVTTSVASHRETPQVENLLPGIQDRLARDGLHLKT